jgi:hypothetical protein
MLLKALLIGMVLGLIKEERVNAAAITIIYLADFLLIIAVRPMVSICFHTCTHISSFFHASDRRS